MKKSLSVLLTIVMMLTLIFSVPVVRAYSNDDADSAPAEVGAEGGADTSASGKTISFDPRGCGWDNYTLIMVYCYEPKTGEVLIDWAAKKKGGMIKNDDGTWTYDFDAKKIALEDGKEYSIIFNADTGVQTHDLLFNTTLYGDTAVGEAEKVENPADSNKSSNIARWKSGKLGPALCITSTGNIVGEQIPSHTTAYGMFVYFLASLGYDGLQNALNYNPNKTAQQIIDDVALKLGLKKGDVKAAIAEAARPDYDRVDSYDWSRDWDEKTSTLPDDENEDHHVNPDSGFGGSSGMVINFDANNMGWQNYTIVMVYCYEPKTGDVLIDWASKKRGGMTNEGNGIWSYDFAAKGINLNPSKQYCLIFNADTGVQTHDLLFDTSCYGDTAVGTAEKVENPADSNKSSNIARWKSGKLGPALCITSTGNVVGEVAPAYTTAYGIFVRFLADTGKAGLQNALNYNPNKTAQQIIDYTALKLGLKKGDVKAAIAEAARPDYDRVDSYDWSKDWDEKKSALPDGENEESHDNPGSGSSGGSGGSSGEWYNELNPYRVRIDEGTPYGDFCSYLTDGGFAEDMRKNGNKTEQQLIDAKAAALGLYRDDVELALSEINAKSVAWTKSNSSLKAGKSGLTYQNGSYYLIGTRDGVDYGIGNVDKNAVLEKKDSGYYVISEVSRFTGDTVQVARYDGNNKFTVVSESVLTMPKYSSYLFFFRPQSDGYKFGFNFDNEYYRGYESASGSSSSGTSDGKIRVYMSEMTDEVSGVKLAWEKPSGVTISKYRVFIHQNGSWQKLADVSGTSYIHTAAKSGNVYRYTLRGLDANGKFCTEYVTSGWYHRYIAAPKVIGVENTKDGVLLKWNPVGGNARYRVYYKDGINWETIGDTYDTSYLHMTKPESNKPEPTNPSSGSGTGTKIYFDDNNTGWRNHSLVMVYCYEPETGDVLIDWASKKRGGMTDEGNGIWSYDFAAKGIDLDPTKQYSLIFNADTGVQTHDLLFDTSCYGDTAVGELTKVENPADSNKSSNIARWKSGKLGPALCITSTGNVVGEQIPSHTTAYGMFVSFLADTGKAGLQNALNYNPNKTAQQIIDDTALKLGLKKGDIRNAIADAAKPDGDRTDSYDWSKDWDPNRSSLPGETLDYDNPYVDDYDYPYVENGDTYRYIVCCVSYDGSTEVGAVDNTGVTNTYVKPEAPTEKPTNPPTAPPTDPPTNPPTEPAPVFLRGDYDDDGEITIMDATRAQNIIAEIMARPDEGYLKAIDADGDKELTIMDATRIQNVVAQLMTMEGTKL